MSSYRQVLLNIVINDRRLIAGMDDLYPEAQTCGLDAKTRALVRVASLVARDGSGETFRWVVDDALRAGANEEEVVAVLLAVAPLVGAARVATTASKVALALDYDLDEALESLDR